VRYKTIKGLIHHLRWLGSHSIQDLKGYEGLNSEDQLSLGMLMGEISNSLGEMDPKSFAYIMEVP